MKPNFNLSIPRPCSEKWESFTKTASGGFCTSCQKTIVDFTAKNDDAVLNFFQNKPSHTCGRFRPDQLRSYNVTTSTTIRPRWMFVKAGIISLLLMFINKHTLAQTPDATLRIENVEHTGVHDNDNNVDTPDQIIKGVVTDENKEPFPGVNIILKGSTMGTTTDADGRFEFPQKLREGDVLIFSFIGYTTEEYTVRKNMDDELTIQCNLEATIMGEVATEEVYTAKRGLRNWWSKITKHF